MSIHSPDRAQPDRRRTDQRIPESHSRGHQADAAHNRENAKTKLPMPVLTIGGTASFGAHLEGPIKPLAARAQSILDRRADPGKGPSV